MRLIAEIEPLIDRQRVRLEAAAARQFERRLDVADQPELLLVLEDVERQRDRLGHSEVVVAPELFGGVDLLEPLLGRPDLVQIQRQHEPLNIPCTRVRG